MKSLNIYLCVLFSIIHLGVSAQLSPTWTVQPEGKIAFQMVTASGNFLVATDQSLSSYAPGSGEKLWSSNELGGLEEANISEIPGSPLLMVNKGGDIRIIDPFSGGIRFHSKASGFEELDFEQMMYRTNGILISGKKADNKPSMVMVDLSSGKIRWEKDEKFGKIIAAREFSPTEMLVVTIFNVHRIQSENGSTIWKEATSADSEAMAGAGELGALFQGLTEQLAADVEFVIRYFENPAEDVFVIASETKRNASTDPNKPSYVYQSNYNAHKMSTGKRMWNEPVEMKGKIGDVAFYKKGIVIMPDDGNKTTINSFDLASGEGQWGKKGKGIKLQGGVYNHMALDQGLLAVSASGKNTFFNVVNPSTGDLAFDKSVKMSGQLVNLIPSAKGVAIITTEEMDILDVNTGDLLLAKTIDTEAGLTALEDGNIIVFDTKGGNLRKVNPNTAEVTDLSSDKLKFDGKENPTGLEVNDKGYLLTSEQNLALFSKTGDLVYQAYFPAPRESGLKRALLIAQAVRAAYIGANAYAAGAAFQAAAPTVSEEDAVGGALVQGIGMAYEEMGNAASDFAKQSLQQATERLKATAGSRDFMVMMTMIDKQNALVKVDKNTGEAAGHILLGDQKNPIYAVDDVTGKIFSVGGDGAVAGYKL